MFGMMRGVKRGGIGVFAGWASGLVLRPAGFALRGCGAGRCLVGVGGVARRVGSWCPPRGFVLMVQRSDFVRKKIDFSESCTTKKRRTAVGCCKLVGTSRGPLQVCSPMPCDPAPTGVQALGQAALRSPLWPRSHAPSPTTCGDGSGSEGKRRGGGAGGRCGDVSVGSERARERAQTPRGGCARRPAWRAKGYFRRQRGAGFGR